jgi:hypothetical protein
MISIPFVLQTPRLSSLFAIHLRQQIKAKVKTGENAFPTRSKQKGLRHLQTKPSLEKPIQNAESNQETKSQDDTGSDAT